MSPLSRDHRSNPDLLTTAEVAAAFRVTPRTVRRWGQTGELECIRVRGTMRFRRADVAALLYLSTSNAARPGGVAKTREDGARCDET